jgi:FkbM family methyltransferase
MTISLQGQPFTVVAQRPEAAKFWRKANGGRWEADTFEFISRHAGADLTFVDIGAWIGPMTIYASRHAGRVVALEPDPVAYKDLVENVRLNGGNVDIWHVGVDNQEGNLTLYAAAGLGQSTSSAVKVDGAEVINIPVVTFEQVSKRIGNAERVIVKIDIEGHEFTVADNLIAFVKRHRAPMHLSVHPRILYDNAKGQMSRLAARRKIHRQTKALIDKLRVIGKLTDTETGKPMTDFTLWQFIFPRTRVHNFTLEVVPHG